MGVTERVMEALHDLQPSPAAVYLWGSQATGDATARSDTDVCVVAGPAGDADMLERAVLRTVRDPDLDVHVFERLPLYLQAQVLHSGRLLAAVDEAALGEYLLPFRRRWEDQAHRQRFTPAEARAMLRR